MSFVKRHGRTLAVAVSCLGVGAGASAIASAGASTTSSSKAATPAAKTARLKARGLRGEMRRAVQGEFVIHTKTGFETVSFERGFVQSVSGDSLTLREGTKNASYKTVTVTIPSGSRVRNNGHAAALSSLTAGEHVGVLQGPAHTWVVARAAK